MRITPLSVSKISVLLLAAVLPALAQPKIEFPNGSTHDFGEIYKGQTVTHHFLIKNSGTEPLVIEGIHSSCGCTAALVSSKVVPPDSTTELKVDFSSGVFIGRTQKSVGISSNDPSTPNAAVYVVSTVLQVLEFEPGALTFNLQGDSLALYRATVKVRNLSTRPIRILSAESRYGGLEIKMNKRVIQAGGFAELQASLRAKGFKGFTGGEVFFQTDFSPQPDHSLSVMVAGGK